MDEGDFDANAKRERERSRSPVNEGDDSGDRDRSKRERRRTPPRGSGKKGGSVKRVFVANIPYECKWQDLKDLFRSEVGDVAYVEMFMDDDKRPKGCAVVEFNNADDAEKAVDCMNKYELRGRQLVVKIDREGDRHRSRDSRSSSQSSSSTSRPGTSSVITNTYGLSLSFLESLGVGGPLVSKVFVSNLYYKVDEEMLMEVFKNAGKVVHCEIMKDTDGKSRGFGIVEYEHPIEAVQAISMLHNQVYMDRKLVVRMDRVAEKNSSSAATSKLPPGLKSLGMGLGLDGKPLSDVSSLTVNAINPIATGINTANAMQRGMCTNMTPAMGAGAMTGGMGMMGGMTGGMDSFGSGLGVSSMNTGMGVMNTGMPSMGASSFPMNTTQDIGARLPSGVMGTSGYSPAASSFSTGSAVSRDYSSSAVSSANRKCVVEIGNLPSNYTWQNLRDLCRASGDVKFAEIKHNGVGAVRFGNESDARNCAERLDRQRVEGRFLDVRLR